jgi:AcrR family transcriptional regulator
VTPSSPAGRPGAVPGQRRSPLQQRSLLRLDQILEAAATLLDEEPYEDITTGLIADRAGVAIGSVYRFFDDKAAVYRALTARHFELYLTRLEAAFADRPTGSPASWTQMTETAIDCYVAMLRGTPGFRGFGDAIDVNLLDTDRDNDTVLADRLLELVTSELRVSPSDAVRLALLIAVTAADALLALAFRRDSQGDETVIAEAKTAVRSYLAPYVDPASSADSTRRRR